MGTKTTGNSYTLFGTNFVLELNSHYYCLESLRSSSPLKLMFKFQRVSPLFFSYHMILKFGKPLNFLQGVVMREHGQQQEKVYFLF